MKKSYILINIHKFYSNKALKWQYNLFVCVKFIFGLYIMLYFPLPSLFKYDVSKGGFLKYGFANWEGGGSKRPKIR